MTFYDEVGGHETFEALVAAFYRGVRGDEKLRALYPEEDLGPAERRLRMFLEQYWGGPTTYSQERGHPRLRMRHVTFAITLDMRDRWLRHMLVAIDEVAPQVGLDEAHDAALRDYVTRAADSLVNTDTEGVSPAMRMSAASPQDAPVGDGAVRPQVTVTRLD